MKELPRKIHPPRYAYDPYDGLIRSMTMLRWLVAPFRRFACGYYLGITDEILIGHLEMQRRLTGRVRAYIIDPRHHYDRLLILYSAYIECTIGGCATPVAVLGPTKGSVRLPEKLDPNRVQVFTGRRPDHIRGFGAFRTAVMLQADRMTERSNGDRVGRRAMQALESTVPNLRDTSLIYLGECYRRRTRLFDKMYRRTCGVPFPSDIGAKWTRPPETYVAIDVRFLWPPPEEEEPERSIPDPGEHKPLDHPATVTSRTRGGRHRHTTRTKILAHAKILT